MRSSNHICTRCPIKTTRQYNSKTIKSNQYELRLPQVFQFYLSIMMHFALPLFQIYGARAVHFWRPPHWPYTSREGQWGDMGLIQFPKSLSSIQLWGIFASLLGKQINDKEWGTKLSRTEIQDLAFLFTTLPPDTGAECHYGVATVWCHPNPSRISI